MARKIKIWLGWFFVFVLAGVMVIWETYFGLLDNGELKISVFLVLFIGIMLGVILWISADYLPFPFRWIYEKTKIGKTKTS